MTGQWAAERAAADLLTELDLEEPSTKRAPSIRLVKVMEGRRERRRKRRERSEVWRIRCPPILCWSIHVYKYSTHLCVCVIFSSGVSGFPRWGRLMRPDSPYNSLAAYSLGCTEPWLSPLPTLTNHGSSGAQLPRVHARDQYTQPESSKTRSDKFKWLI